MAVRTLMAQQPDGLAAIGTADLIHDLRILPGDMYLHQIIVGHALLQAKNGNANTSPETTRSGKASFLPKLVEIRLTRVSGTSAKNAQDLRRFYLPCQSCGFGRARHSSDVVVIPVANG